MGQATYDAAYGTSFPTTSPTWGYVNIHDNAVTFQTVAGTTLALPLQFKAIHDEMGAAFDEYGRMSGRLGLEIPKADSLRQTFVLQNFVDPPTEILNDSVVEGVPTAGDGTQIWKISHNGVDTHPIHFHLMDVQLINRVGWDGFLRTPDPTELGWKETVRVSPLEDTIVALRPVLADLPWKQPDSIRPLNPSMPLGSEMGFSMINPQTGGPLNPPTVNEMYNFGHEFTWHCHILSHEEMDMMRPIQFNVNSGDPLPPEAPTIQTATAGDRSATVNFTTPFDGGSPITGFVVVVSPTGAQMGGAGSPIVVGGLINGQTYTVRVAAINAVGLGPLSAASGRIIPIGTPDPPVAPIIAVGGPASATVYFGTNMNNGGSPIRYYTAISNPGNLISTGTQSGILVRGLTNGQPYTFTVTATNALGTGLPSTASNAVIPLAKPDAPLSVSAQAGNAQATVTFTPGADGGSPVVFYWVTPQVVGGAALAPRVALGSPYTVTGLSNGTPYTFAVAAVNQLGMGPATVSNQVRPATAPPTAPSNLKGVSTIANGVITVALTWQDRSNNEDSFVLQRASNQNFTQNLMTVPLPMNTTAYSDSPVNQFTTYYYRVGAVNGLGTAYSQNLAVTTPRIPPNAATNLQVTGVTRTSIALAWTDNANNELGFYVQRSDTGTGGWRTVGTVGANLTVFNNSGLRNNRVYYYQVIAYSTNGPSTPSNIVSGQTLP